ncbi:MAG: hypothetical protein ACD_2C00131G0003 [uncultured bacterium (gcode 4)]|uniref:Tetratricopeptide repeat protein n=1 Tax=uncultured bacterium (gcode 4) TaxID=1234023 RepID=K2G385_9BACT|nr:MAG: hypothetical protein ACD_2C00131G0003 [uncultured bacterium (gcode 4)]
MASDKGKVIDWISLYNEWEYEKAIVQFQGAIDAEEVDELAMFYLWNTFWALWKFEKAISIFTEILAFDSKNEKVLKAKEIFENLKKNSKESFSYGEASSAESAQSFPAAEFNPKTSSKKDIPVPPSSAVYEESVEEINPKEKDINVYGFLKSNEAEKFLATDGARNMNIKNIIDNIWTNSFDKDEILCLIRKGNEDDLMRFIKCVKLRNSILDHLADSNVLPPRKYNTIITQIVNINAEFWLAFLMFNLWEHKYNDIISKLWKAPIAGWSDMKDPIEPTKIWIIKVVSNFLIWIFSFEKAFENENNKLRYFKYLFIFLWFVWVLILVGYWFKTWVFSVDVRWRNDSPGENIQKNFQIKLIK